MEKVNGVIGFEDKTATRLLFPAGATRPLLFTNDASFIHVTRTYLAVVRVKEPTKLNNSGNPRDTQLHGLLDFRSTLNNLRFVCVTS